MRLVALQSNYIPWKGYFDLMSTADRFVVYDSVQYTKNDWRNRNQVIGPNGPTWLTIPVQTAGRPSQTIREASIQDGRWSRKHWMTVTQALGKRPHFGEYKDAWQSWFEMAADLELLHDINVMFLRGLAKQLDVGTLIVDDVDFDTGMEAGEGTATERLVALCRAAGATTYITGPAGLDYMELEHFRAANIAVEVIDYTQYDVYPQAGDEFQHSVSVLDLLANLGASAGPHLLGRTSAVPLGSA